MPRNISFSMTTQQFLDKSKTVTRRLGWWTLKPDDVLCGVEKAMGLKKGEKIRRLGLIKIVSVRRERLEAITAVDVTHEGYPDMWPREFVEMFCRSHRCKPDAWVNRIEFRYLETAE
jgi:hypothetical protein